MLVKKDYKERADKLFQVFTETIGDTVLTVGDVKEIIQMGYELFKKNKKIRSEFNGTNIETIGDKGEG